MKRETILKIADKAILDYERETKTEITAGTSDYIKDMIEDIIDEYKGIDEFELEKEEIYNEVLTAIRSAERINRKGNIDRAIQNSNVDKLIRDKIDNMVDTRSEKILIAVKRRVKNDMYKDYILYDMTESKFNKEKESIYKVISELIERIV